MDSFESGSETADTRHPPETILDPFAARMSDEDELMRQRKLRDKLRRKAGLTIRAPLSPKPAQPHWADRNDSSGSEDSFSHSQTGELRLEN
jgi:hypothetical protein